MRRRPFVATTGLALVLLLAWLARAALWQPFAVQGMLPADGWTRVAGVVHVHTTCSDGGGTPEEAIAAARSAGLGFVVLTDHNNLDAKRLEGYRDGVLVIVGSEVSTTAGHVLGLGIPDPAFRFSGDALDAIEDVRDLGGSSFVAHPTSARSDYAWTGWDLPGPWGIELLNGDSEWRDAGWLRLLSTVARYPLNPRYALLESLAPLDKTLARWDQELSARDVAGIVGADAHSRVRLRRDTAVRFPSYESLFALAQNHVLLPAPLSGRLGADIQAVVGALARGRSYLALDALAPGGGFSFTAAIGARTWTIGDTVPPAPGLRLRAGGAVPRGARLRLLRDGQLLEEAGARLDSAVERPGVYRVEVRLPGWPVPWILTNPIYVFGPEQTSARAARAAWPEPRVAPAPAEIVDDFDGPATGFAAEFDPASQMDRRVIDRSGGIDGRGAARMAFRLGFPAPSRPFVWCALVERRKRDFSGRRGLVFAVRADGVYRLWVQVRDENPASSDGGTEWWFASLRTATAWQRVAVPFSRLRSLNKHSDGRLDLDKVRELVFVLDQGAVKPGTRGTIWIDSLGVY
jgi:hypothetical protein